MSSWSSSVIASHIHQFLETYRLELSKKNQNSSRMQNSQSTSYWPEVGGGQFPDPTTANALNTCTVVLRKKSSNLRNSPFEGVPLPNYRIRPQDVRPEVYEWIAHFLSLKNCPLELATLVANRISSKMSEQVLKNCDENNEDNFEEKSAALCSTDSSPLVDVCSLDTVDHTPRSSLPAALSSVDVARQSRKLVDEYMEELGANPDNAMAVVSDYLDSAPTNGNQTAPTPFTTSIYSVKNRRTTMEDRHIIIQNLNKTLDIELPKQYSYYAVFDGHAGVDAASFSTAHLHYYLVESAAFCEGRIEDAFREAFEKTDSLYIKRYKEDGVDKLKPSGTTALCALIEDNRTVYLAWAGDSQAVLVRNGCYEEIMLPHKPDLDSERVRIQDLGGLIIYMDTWRVNGVLSVTRAIGDPEHKPLIISEPAIAKFEIDSSLDFLVLGCDGLFDQLTSQDITSHVFEYLCKNETHNPQEVMHGVSAYLSQMAINEGSNDNITTIVIFFKPFEQLVATGYPTKSLVEDELLHKDVDSNSTTLQTTNGGHFPYTDFSQLPPGTLFKLTDDFNEDNQANGALNPFDVSSGTNVEQSFVIIESETKEQTFNPFDNVEAVAVDDVLSDEQCEDEFDFVPTPAGGFAPTQPNQIDLDSQLMEKCQMTFNEEEQLTTMEVSMSNANHSLQDQEPSTDATSVEVEKKTQDMLANDFSQKLVQLEDTTPNIHLDESKNENNPFAEESFVTVCSTSPDNSHQANNVVLNQLDDLLGLNNLEEQVSVAKPLQEEISNEVNQQNDTESEVVQHPSDSGYCYTNSICEFSTSFPTQQKLEDNFCSTPVVEQAPLSHSDESGLDNQSSTILSATTNTTDPGPIEMQNNEIIGNTQDISNVKADDSNDDSFEQVQKEDSNAGALTTLLSNHSEGDISQLVAFESPPSGFSQITVEESPKLVPQEKSQVTPSIEVPELMKNLDKKVESSSHVPDLPPVVDESVQNENAHTVPPQTEEAIQPISLEKIETEAIIDKQETKAELLNTKTGHVVTSNVKKPVSSTISKTKSPLPPSTKVAAKPTSTKSTVTSRAAVKPSARLTSSTAATSRVTSATSKVNNTMSGVTKEPLARKAPVPRASTLSRTTTTAPRATPTTRPTPATTRPGTTTRPTLTSTRPTSTTTKPSSSLAATRPGTTTLRSTAPRPTTKTTTVGSTAKPLTSRIASSSSSQLKTASSKTATEVKPTRRSLPANTKPETRKPIPAISKPSTTRPTTSIASRVGSLRTTAPNAASKVPASKIGIKPIPPKPANGASTTGIKAVKKPTASQATQPKSTEVSKPTVPNGVVKQTSTLKRNNLIGVENSLKQELEDAAMNEMNALNPASNEGNGLAQ